MKVNSRHVVFAFACHLLTKLAHLFRCIGLDVINFTHRQLCLSPLEPRHIVLSRSVWVALSRCFIHTLPVLVSLFLVIINLRGLYIGEHLLGVHSSNEADSVVLALIQVAAKFQVSMSLHAIWQG
jgi:hypothetical protein